MGVEESSIFKRLCSRRRINVGCLGTRILRLPLPWPGTRTQIGLAENGQKGKVRQKIKWHEPDLSSRAAANGSKSHPRCEKKRIPHRWRLRMSAYNSEYLRIFRSGAEDGRK